MKQLINARTHTLASYLGTHHSSPTTLFTTHSLAASSTSTTGTLTCPGPTSIPSARHCRNAENVPARTTRTVVEARLQSGVQGDEGRAQLGRGEVCVRAYICVRMCRRTVSDACGVLCDAWGRTRCACELDQVSHRRRTLAAIEHRRKLADL